MWDSIFFFVVVITISSLDIVFSSDNKILRVVVVAEVNKQNDNFNAFKYNFFLAHRSGDENLGILYAMVFFFSVFFFTNIL